LLFSSANMINVRCNEYKFPPRNQGSSPDHVVWDLWWTKRHYNRFCLSSSVFPAKHSAAFSTLIIIIIIIIRGWLNRLFNALNNSGRNSFPTQELSERETPKEHSLHLQIVTCYARRRSARNVGMCFICTWLLGKDDGIVT
jgi:hypothetical protein